MCYLPLVVDLITTVIFNVEFETARRGRDIENI